MSFAEMPKERVDQFCAQLSSLACSFTQTGDEGRMHEYLS